MTGSGVAEILRTAGGAAGGALFPFPEPQPHTTQTRIPRPNAVVKPRALGTDCSWGLPPFCPCAGGSSSTLSWTPSSFSSALHLLPRYSPTCYLRRAAVCTIMPGLAFAIIEPTLRILSPSSFSNNRLAREPCSDLGHERPGKRPYR